MPGEKKQSILYFFFPLDFIKNSSVLYTYSYNKSKSNAASVSKCLQRC